MKKILDHQIVSIFIKTKVGSLFKKLCFKYGKAVPTILQMAG